MVAEHLDPLDTLPIEHASVSALARDLRSGETLVSHAPDRPLPPASNTKLVTTAIGLATLGPDYRFETRVHAAGNYEDGHADNGHLDGDLVLAGRGAPDLSVADLRTLAEHVREAGVQTVAGDLLLDGSWFDDRALGPGWCVDDQRYSYGAPSTALTLRRNVVDVIVTSQNGEVTSRVEPDTTAVNLAMDVETTDDDESDLSAETDPDTGVVEVSGTLAAGDSETVSAPVSDPLAHCGAAFQSELADAGVTVEGNLHVGPAADETTAIGIHQSDQLATICREMNVPSDNFLAETIARTVAAETNGEGTWGDWSDLSEEFFDELGVEGHRIRDGSGLSRYNHVPARGFVELVGWAIEQPWGEVFLASLPEAGEDGTLANRLDDVNATVRAKTGTLTGTRALSGVIEDDDGEPVIVFSVQLSNLVGELEAEGREIQDEFVRRLVDCW